MKIIRRTSLLLGALLMLEASHSNLLEARGGGGHGGGEHFDGGRSAAHGGDWRGHGGNWHGGGYGHNTYNNYNYYGHGGGWYGYGAPFAIGVGIGAVGTAVTTTNSNCWVDANGVQHCTYY